MTPGQMDARKRKMAQTIENPPNYLSKNAISDKKKWKNLKDDGLPRY
jgi:hypothetical protein